MRAGAALLAVTMLAVGLYRDSLLIALDRGRPGAVLADVAALSPSGARIAFAEARLKAVVGVAAGRTGYPARFAAGCAPADFLLAVQSRWAAPPTSFERCGATMQSRAGSLAIPARRLMTEFVGFNNSWSI